MFLLIVGQIWYPEVAEDDSRRAVGLQLYASKQAGLWRTFSEKAMARFRVEIPELWYEDW